jgi:hypothetical protein
MRDKLKGQEYWDFYISDTLDFLDEVLTDLGKPGRSFENRLSDASIYESFTFNTVSALYSSGAPMDEVVSAARKLLLEAYPAFIGVCRENPAQARNDYGGGWDFRTRYLCLAVLCRLTPEESAPLIEAVDFWPERDAVWERLISLLGHGDGRPSVTGLVWPEAYEQLFETLKQQASTPTRLTAIRTFLDGWLKQMRTSTNPFYSNEKNPNNTYVGYWCFEAAAAVAAMGIDDIIFRDHPNYPKDWADWARKA